MRKDLITLFSGLGLCAICIAPLTAKDPAVVIIDIGVGIVCFFFAYTTRHAPVEE